MSADETKNTGPDIKWEISDPNGNAGDPNYTFGPETNNARRETAWNKHNSSGIRGRLLQDNFNAGFDACEREMSAEAALTRLGIETYIDALEASKKERDKLKEQNAKLEAEITALRLEHGKHFGSWQRSEQQLTQWRKMCEKLYLALNGPGVYHCTPESLRRATDALADYNAFLEGLK